MLEYFKKSEISIYNCDNLELLKETDSNSINLIYCDILYNTGKVLEDYNDNIGSPQEAIEWYKPRIAEMKRVLADNGSIFIHCNWRLDSYMRILMDEIFGTDCFRNRIYRKHSKERSFYKNFDSQVDIILYYVKDSSKFVFNGQEENTSHKLVPLFENGYIEGRSGKRIVCGQEINLCSRERDNYLHWLVTTEQLNEIILNDDAIVLDGLPYRIDRNKPIGNLWAEDSMLDVYSRVNLAETYDTPKPDAILERIILTCSNEHDVVADFFMGGGTTAVVAHKLNRKFIGCDISEKACNVTIDKLRR